MHFVEPWFDKNVDLDICQKLFEGEGESEFPSTMDAKGSPREWTAGFENNHFCLSLPLGSTLLVTLFYQKWKQSALTFSLPKHQSERRRNGRRQDDDDRQDAEAEGVAGDDRGARPQRHRNGGADVARR